MAGNLKVLPISGLCRRDENSSTDEFLASSRERFILSRGPFLAWRPAVVDQLIAGSRDEAGDKLGPMEARLLSTALRNFEFLWNC